MSKILISVSNSFVVRNFLRSDFLASLLEKNASIVLLAPHDKIEYYRKEFASPHLVFDSAPQASHLEKFFKWLESSCINTPTTRLQHYHDFMKEKSKTPLPLRVWFLFWRRFFALAGGNIVGRMCIRFLYSFFPARAYERLLDKHAPDLVFCPTLIYGDEFALLKAAKRQGRKHIGMISSWDNFYSKTFLRVLPDKLLVQTNLLKSQAISICDMDPAKVAVVGVPQYDAHFNKTFLRPRDEFIKSVGGDSSKKTILYALSGKVGLDIDYETIEVLYEIIQSGKLGDVQVLLRPYPKMDFSEGKLDKFKKKYGFLMEAATSHVGSSKDNWEFDDRAIELLINSIAHADVVITIYSTFFIEAAIFDKPLIGITFDGHVRHYYNSARRFFDWDHLRDIKGHGGVRLANNKTEFADFLASYLKNPTLDKEGRARIVAQQCEFIDGGSAKRIAFELLKLSNN